MNGNIYKELFNLVRSEGERLVVVDPNSGEGLVVLRLTEYQKLREDGIRRIPVTSDNKLKPTLARNSDKNLYFWDDENEEKDDNLGKLDKQVYSGRIIERKTEKTEGKKKELKLEDETAGGEYYFEPTEEIGL